MPVATEKYELVMNFLYNQEFKGDCTVLFSSDDEELILDAKELHIEKLLVNNKEKTFVYDETKKKLKIEKMEKSEGKIQILYTGKYGNGLSGLYRAGNGQESMITTQFESNDASAAFPCFDNPSMKAIFELTVIIKEDMDAISNMPQLSNTRDDAGSRKIKFSPTPPMSTYLLYIGIGKFITKTKKHGSCEIILAKPGSEMRSDDYPLDVADKCLTFYEEYFNIPYALPKMHLIAVPDFAAGAMENWGAITFREDALLNNENTDSQTKIMITVVIAHEIAHQWFGNLVTMKWWNDLWLNESFATFMSSLCVDKIFPEYEEEKTYYLNETVGSMASDALKSSHPINVEVREPEDIEQVFDEISYGKGGSILRMIYHYVGEEKFRMGLSSYLSKFRYGNAEGPDLWNELEKISGLKITSIMDNWTNQSGFPLIKADYNGKKLMLEQEQLLLSGEKSEKLWKVPIFIQTEKDEKKILMEDKTLEIEIDDFIKINYRGMGYYQTLYKNALSKVVMKKVNALDSMARTELVCDNYFQLLSGKIPIEKFSIFAEEISKSFSTPSALLLINNFDRLNRILYDRTEFMKSSNNIIQKIIENGTTKEDNLTMLDRISVQKARSAYAKINYEFAREMSKKFDGYYDAQPDEREYIAISRAIISTDLDDIINKFKEAQDDSDREILITAMGWVPGKKNHKKIIKMMISGDIKKQDMPIAIMTMIINPDSRKYISSILLPVLRNISKAFGNTGLLSTAAFLSIPLLGLENENKVRKVMSKLNYNEIKMGYEKGFEMLEVYKKLRENVR